MPAGQPFVIRVRNLDATAEEFESPALRIEKVIAGNGEGLVCNNHGFSAGATTSSANTTRIPPRAR